MSILSQASKRVQNAGEYYKSRCYKEAFLEMVSAHELMLAAYSELLVSFESSNKQIQAALNQGGTE